MKSILLILDPPGARAFADLAAAEAAAKKLFADGNGVDESKIHACTCLPSNIKDLKTFSAAQMASIHNAIPGTRPVKKFENRDAMVRRMMEAFATIEIEKASNPLVDDQPEFLKRKAGDTRRARDRDDEDRITMPERKPGAAKAGKRKSKGGSKTELVLGLLRRKEGATAEQIMKATDWQRHTVRGFLSTVGKKPGVRMSYQDAEGGRIYKAA